MQQITEKKDLRYGNLYANEQNSIAKLLSSSLLIPGADTTLLQTFADLLPPPPRIIDPANPSNNLYKSGVGPNPYGVGDGKWATFRHEIDTLDLTVRAECTMGITPY